ncbi:hypothetical protein KSF_089360 [Reticulibacter mediterranei]|uniref:TIR domain-containing protein n=2 Tax=Reticulibacter mediterranei TaxID=2778369 RepID=A0A8J3N7R2_9CHLR|nr:hypothetical protein KSF_089360 [Reticulibacter mediterranei]
MVEVDDMANEEHVKILRQGVAVWNEWRKKYPEVRPDLSSDAFDDFNKVGRNNLVGINLQGANLQGIDFSFASLRAASFGSAKLNGANLSRADLLFASLNFADISGANLYEANISYADLSGANLYEANFAEAKVEWTIFGAVDLQSVKGLETVFHLKPSIISVDTLERSRGNIPEAFLQGAGVSDNFIAYVRSLVATPIEYYTCFISYSSKDHDFAERLYADLQHKGVRCWFAPEDMKIGDKIRPRIDESIRMYDKLLLVLSEHSICSEWVEHEVEMALAKERAKKQTVLFPVRLDNAILEMNQDGWPSEVRHTRHIGNFEHWKNHNQYQNSFQRLLRDLQSGKISNEE